MITIDGTQTGEETYQVTASPKPNYRARRYVRAYSKPRGIVRVPEAVAA